MDSCTQYTHNNTHAYLCTYLILIYAREHAQNRKVLKTISLDQELLSMLGNFTVVPLTF